MSAPRHQHFWALLLTLALAGGLLGGCGSQQAADAQGKTAYPGFSSPKAALDTFFTSAIRRDYATTYDAYYAAYHQRITRDEFVSHRKDGSTLTSYRIDSIEASGSSAVASVTLTFAAKGAASAQRTVVVREDLVNQSGNWKIRVW